MSSNLNITNNWFDAFNEHDLEKLLSLYHDEAVHFSPKLRDRQPETQGLIKGKDALRAWWKDSFERLPSLKYIPTKFVIDDYRVFMEYTRHVDNEDDMTVGELLEIEAGVIVSSRVYHS